ncbi:MAG: glycosyltransferase [Bacilli bacterium]|nr:glycosyltransferase [Bacilli bacterium]
MSNNKLYDKNFYETNKKDIVSAEKILPFVLDKLNPKSIVDFGCGAGTWLNVAKQNGCKEVLGLDGEYVDNSWQIIDKNEFKSCDLTSDIKLNKKYDLAICLEVAEHIYEDKSETFLKNLTNGSDIILFSCAIPEQGGTHHVNEQYPSYWVKRFEKYGYRIIDGIRANFWDDKNIAFWYRQNMVLFVKNNRYNEVIKLFSESMKPLDIVHPAKLEKLTEEYQEQIKKLSKERNDYKLDADNLCKKLEKNNKNTVIPETVNPKVTVVVPVFNVRPFLRECLDSILNQTMKEIEVICGDGGSNDGSLEILKEYEQKDKRVKVISRDGSGYGESVNECMDMAKGEYIGIVESDDCIKPEMYETLYKIAKENDLDWIRSDIFFYYSGMPEDEQLVRESITYCNPIYNRVLDPKYDVSPYHTGLRSWSGIYKKEFLDFYQIRHHETPGGSYQDVGWYLKTLYDARKVYFLDKPFYMWRQDNPGSSIHYNSKKLVEKSVKEWELNKQYLEYRTDTTTRMWGSFNYRRFYSFLWTIDMAKGEDKEEMINFAKKEFKEALNSGKIDRAFFDDYEWKKFTQFIN